MAFSYLKPSTMDYFAPAQRFWRVISIISLIYFCFIILMLNHRPANGRAILGFLDPRLNQEVTKGHHTYDDNCEFTPANVWDNFDHYYLVHLGNWFLSSFVIRDFYILHFKHVLDEVIELSWQHILPHFRECWWDHILMDICLSNIPAVTVGLWCVSKCGLRLYDYFGKEGKKSLWEYDFWYCHKRFGILFYMVILLVLHFLNGFFINNNLLIPPVHPFPVIRLLIWFGLGSIGYREAFEDARTWNTHERKYNPVAGRYRWLVTAVLTSEVILCWKYRMGTGHIDMDAAANTPIYIWLPWTACIVLGIAYWVYLRFKPGHTTKYLAKA